ncbi:MAG: transglutaminase-like domain-containing protein [Methanobacterium sp.]|nr:transglutaminase-like domain-containing protein [Methanobacterium sp.]
MLIFLSIALFLNISICNALPADNGYMQYNMLSADNIGISNTDTIVFTNIQNTETQEQKMAAGAPVVVNGLTLAQLKDGISRVQTFFNKNGRLPKFINFGTRKIAMATFQKNIATQGLKINTNIKPTPGTDTSSIDTLSKTLISGLTSSYNKAVAIFNWVKNNINYSFYYNTKYGAAGTLKYRTGNCCDYSNLLVALARSAGITARYVHGTCQFSSGKWYGHVWTQFYVNGKWYNADAISTSNSFGVINNWNTATYKFHNYYTTLPF